MAEEAIGSAKTSIWLAVRCGVELIRLQKEYGIKAGRPKSSHGETIVFMSLVERHVRISRATAYRWMQDARMLLPYADIDEQLLLEVPREKQALLMNRLEAITKEQECISKIKAKHKEDRVVKTSKTTVIDGAVFIIRNWITGFLFSPKVRPSKELIEDVKTRVLVPLREFVANIEKRIKELETKVQA